MLTNAHLALLRELAHRDDLTSGVVAAAVADIHTRREDGDVHWEVLPWLLRGDLTAAQRTALVNTSLTNTGSVELGADALMGPHHTPEDVTTTLNTRRPHSRSRFADVVLAHPALTAADIDHLAAHGHPPVLARLLAGATCTPTARTTALTRLDTDLTAAPGGVGSTVGSLLGPVRHSELPALTTLHLRLRHPRLVHDIGAHLARAGHLSALNLDHILTRTPTVDADEPTLRAAKTCLTELLRRHPQHPGVRSTITSLGGACRAVLVAEKAADRPCPDCGFSTTESVDTDDCVVPHEQEDYAVTGQRTERAGLAWLATTVSATFRNVDEPGGSSTLSGV